VKLADVKHNTKMVDLSEMLGPGSVFEIQKFTRKTHGERQRIIAENATPERIEKAAKVCDEIRAKAQAETDPDKRQALLDTAEVNQQMEIGMETIVKLTTCNLIGGVYKSPFDEKWDEAAIDELEKINPEALTKLFQEILDFNRPPVTGNSPS
jgi:hypothetical protein